MNSQTDNFKRFFIKTLGCKVNQYESQAIREILSRSGFEESSSADMADIYIVNTCTVTREADKESRHVIGSFHRTNPNAKIVVTGCYVEKDSSDVSFMPGVAHIVRNSEKPRIADILNDVRSTMYEVRNDSAQLKITDFKDHTKAFVKVQDGCDNFCAYCKVPLVRPTLSSRPIREITEEVAVLAGKGFKEMVLTGICLGAWGSDLASSVIAKELKLEGETLVDVLKALDKIPGDFRIRLSSIEPKYVTDALIEFISGKRRMCSHLHIPLQSGDDSVLKRMKRPYTAADYRRLIAKIREKMPDIAITTDILIGFPGETGAAFEKTLNFVKDILPARTHIFTYSRRSGTAASNMSGEVERDELKRRYHRLEVAALSSSYLYRRRFLGRELEVLVESRRDKKSSMLKGYSSNYINILFDGPDTLSRSIAPVRMTDANLIYTLGAYAPQL
jgi:threonylcarbamoyladenosine tRNA methylthiotransferase MtaB